MQQQEANTLTLPSPLLNTKQTSEVVNKSEAWLERARWAGTDAPKFLKLGRSVRYRLEDVEAWINQHPLCSSTTESKKVEAQTMRDNLTQSKKRMKKGKVKLSSNSAEVESETENSK